MTPPLKIAVLGPGGIADQRLAPALTALPDDAVLWSVLSRDAARAESFAARHGARSPTPVYTDLDALLRDPALDAVLIATPDALHAAQCVAAARAGKHVLCEKPLATSERDAQAMTRACEENRVKLGVAYHLRWHTGHRALHARAQRGDLGTLLHMQVAWSFQAAGDGNWRAGGDVGRWWASAAVGTHCVDAVRWMMVPTCGEIAEVKVLTTNSTYGKRDETAVIAMRFASGATAEIMVSVLFHGARRMELFGSHAVALCEQTLGPRGEGSVRVAGEEMSFVPSDPYAGEIADFVRAVRENAAPEVDGAEGARNVAVLEKVG